MGEMKADNGRSKALGDRPLTVLPIGDGATDGVLRKLVSDGLIRKLAGDTYYRRGLDYFQRGLVSSLDESGNSIRSVVVGTERYAVVLTAKAKALDYRCECPIGVDEEFCKHCVATALAWLHRGAMAGAGEKKAVSPDVTDEDVVKALQAEDKGALIKLLLDWSEKDEALRERLMLIAAGRNGAGTLIEQARKFLERAIRTYGFVDYQEMTGYAARVDAALDAVETLLKGGQAAGMVDLCEVGMRRLAAAVENTDDSDGYMSRLIERLQSLHLRACEEAKPDPEMLARRLFSFELKAEYDVWSHSAEKYANVLGATGLAIFREMAEAEWAKVPVRTDNKSYREQSNRYRLTAIMESLARQSGDMEQLVAVLERDLSSAHQYLRIAGIYREAGKHDKALAWAERGVASAPGYDGATLRIFVAEEYQRRERHADALRMIWIEFRNGPGLTNYKLLQRFARKAEEWDDWRERALTHIRRTLAGGSGEGRNDGAAVQRWRDRKQDHSLLVEIFLDERKTADGWREGQAGGCRNDLWLRLAEEREKTHPEDAAPIYLRLAEQAIVNAQSNRYEPAIKLLEKAAGLLHSLGRSPEFEELFETLRRKYKAKRNLQKLAEERRRFLYLHK
jgi:uncharacterized Zn finger protein